MSKRAVQLYTDFHRYNPKEVGKFPASFFIPEQATLAGPALFVLYRSGKCDPVTHEKPKKPINYIHEHDKGVKVYIVDGEGPERVVPKYIHSVGELVLLGECVGFGYTDECGDDVEAECSVDIELYAIPSGKGLIVVEKKRKVRALIWGGKLRVEPRGIVG